MAKNKKEKNNKTNSNTNSSAKNTTKSTTKTNPPAGVSQESWNTANSEFKGSKELDSQRDTRENYASKAENFYSNTNIVDDNTKSKMNASLNDYLSPEIEQTNTYLDSQLGKIQSGKTSWSEQYGNAINDFLNREKFEYDVDDDQLFQQALASAMNSGKSAMQDTIGQASALTGGYGSTYATSVGNQAYNQFIEDAYNNLPEYYQMAMEAYQMEGQEMLNRVNILGTADDKEYSRMVQGFDTTLNYSNTLWDRGYNEWATTTSNAINYGNFLLNENTTIGNNLKNAYDISSNEYELLYGEEYNTWKTGVENAWKAVSTEQTGYWNEKDNTYKYDSLAQEKEISDKEIEYKYAALEQDDDQFDKEFNAKYTPDGNGGYVAKGTTSNGDSYSLTDTEIKNCKEIYAENGGGETGYKKVIEYLNQKGKPVNSDSASDVVMSVIGYENSKNSNGENADGTINWKNVDIEMVEDTMNGFLGLGGLIGHYDTNDKVKINGKVYETSEIHSMLDKDTTLTDTEKELIKKKIRDLGEGEVYNFNKKNSK